MKDDDQTDEIILPITATYNTQNRLSAILMTNFQQQTIPRVMIQLLALILPSYQQLHKFTIRNCRIDMYVVHELGKMLPFTTITDVCLDDCPIKQTNYEELLQNTTCIKNLSLCRCNINDEVCERIASTLHYLESAERSLVTLNLTSNCIGDEGAKHLAQALRSNRHLRYLNLADNLISDDGASLIFNSFIEFPLTYDENINRLQRFLAHLKKKHVYKECLQKLSLSQKSPPESIRSTGDKSCSLDKRHGVLSPKRASHTRVKRKSIERESVISPSSLRALSEDYLPKAELIANELVEPFVDPFCTSSLRIEDYPRCVGNFVLCYLNLAYNYLTYVSVRKLLSVVEYQKGHYNKQPGLMRVILDGNYLPVVCTELMTIQKLLNQHEASLKNNNSFNSRS